MKRRFLFDHGVAVGGGGQQRMVKVGELSVRATIDATTLNEQERTVDVCFGTDTPILMGYWERYYEILSFDNQDCDMSRLNSGAAMLDNHNRWGGTADQPGVVEKAWTKDGKGYATLRFANDKSTRDGVPDGPGEKIFQKVKDKIVRNVSVGYTVQEYAEVDAAGSQSQGIASENKIPTYRAIKWQPFEISFVGIPADIGAGVRGSNEEGHNTRNQETNFYQVPIFSNQNQNTDEMKRRFLFPGGPNEGGGGGGEQQRGQTAAPAAPAAPAPAPAPDNNRSAQPDASTVALTRSEEIMEICEIAGGYSLAEVRALIAGKDTVAQVRAAIIEKKKAGTGATQHGNNRSATVGDDQRPAKREAMTNALLHRVAPHLFKLEGDARDFRGLDMMDYARECVEYAAPGHTRGMSRMAVAEASLNIGQGRSGMMSTSDLPIILGNIINRTLRAAYESQPSEWRQFCRQTSFKDFRQKTLVQLSEGQDMTTVKEGGEYERFALSDGKQTLQVIKYGRIIPITWETLINDDLDALGRVPQIFAEMGARKQADLIYALILGGGVQMGDGNTLFHASHNNLLTGSAINIDSMGLMRKIMRQQKGIAGKQYLNLRPKFLVTGPNNEQLALQYTSSDFVPVTNATQNVWKGMYTPIIDPRFNNSNQWIGVADPATIDTIHYGFLEGEGEMFTQQREGFEVDGIEVKARMVFGCNAIDFRGFASNPGS
jgi:hypothetical protein